MYKRSKFLLTSWIICALYLTYILAYFWAKIPYNPSIAESIAIGLATMLIGPHIIITFLALIFNIIGWSSVKPWAALTGAILYSVAAIMFIRYCIFVIPSIVLSFVGFAKMKKATPYSVPVQRAQIQPSQMAPPTSAPWSTPGKAPEKDWADKIAPVLPIVYTVWFCGIAAGVFCLLRLIFK